MSEGKSQKEKVKKKFVPDGKKELEEYKKMRKKYLIYE